MALPPIFGAGPAPQSARMAPIDPAAYGGGLAQDIGAVGQEVQRAQQVKTNADHQIALIADQHALAAAKSDRIAALVDGELALKSKVAEMRSTAAPGAAGHVEAVDKLVDDWSTQFRDTLTDPRLVADLTPDIARIAGGIKGSEQMFAIGQRADKLVTDYQGSENSLGNSIYTNPTDQDGVRNAVTLTDKLIDGMAIPDDKKAELRRNRDKNFAVKATLGTANSDPQSALHIIDSGALNDVLEGHDIISLRTSVQSMVDRDASRARAAQGAALSQFKEKARTTIEDVNAGGDVDPAVLDGMAAQAEAAGESDLAHDLRNARASAIVTRQTAADSPAVIAEKQRQIEQTADWRKNPELVTAHTALGRRLDQVTAAVKADPLGVWSNGGGHLGTIDLNDPASVRQRWVDATAAQKQYGGQLTLLRPQEVAPLREQFDKGGAADKARTIATFAGFGNGPAKAFLRQIAPAKPEYAVLADLATMRNRAAGETTMREALNGWAELKANPKLFDKADPIGDVMRDYGPAISAMDGVEKAGVMQVARGVYAWRKALGGDTRYDRALWKASYQDALGAAPDGTGGIGKTRGGQPMVLPRGMTQGDVDLPLARADDKSIIAASHNDWPMWGGRPMPLADLKKQQMVRVADGYYKFRSDGGFVQSKTHAGQDFVLDIRSLAQIAPRTAPQASDARAALRREAQDALLGRSASPAPAKAPALGNTPGAEYLR